ncbi:MAG: response regulator [Candidatus Competibacteraceae bacterium]
MSTEKTTPCILVVDDCAITCQLLTALLTTEGYRVTAARDGASGLAAARNHSPDLAIVDLHLPDLSGIELAGRLQPDVPFLALTIDRSPEAVQACIDQGALGYLVKPLDAETFLRHVQVALERGREQRNLRRALRDNPAVNKALGVLMGFLRISEQRAFKMLVTRASARNVKAVALAGDILAASETLARTAMDNPFRTNIRGTEREAARAFLHRFRSGRH